MKVRKVNKVLYPFGFIQDKVIKKGTPSMDALTLFPDLVIAISPLFYRILHQTHRLRHFGIQKHWDLYLLSNEKW